MIYSISQEKVLNNSLVSRQIGGMKLSALYSISDKSFFDLIKKIENDSLFIRLTYPRDKIHKAISYTRFPNTDFSEKFLKIEDMPVSNNSGFDINSFLKKREEVIPIIKKLGIDKFKEYLLYNEGMISADEMAEKCQITVFDVQKLKDFINDFFIQSEFYYSSAIPTVNKIFYSKTASIKRISPEDFAVEYFSLSLVRGRYSIDYDKINDLKNKGLFSKEEMNRLDKLLNDLQIINRMKTTIFHLVQHIVETQAEYLKSADLKKINPLKQKELADKIKVHPSVICRLIKCRSIEMPWGEEKPIKFFFSNRKDEILNLIRVYIKKEKNELMDKSIQRAYSDEQIKRKLEKEHKIKISRRAISEFRNKINIPCASVRMKIKYSNSNTCGKSLSAFLINN